MKQLVEKILNEYADARRAPFHGHPLVSFFTNDIPARMYATGLIDPGTHLITGSIGNNSWTHVPWIGILDRQLTTTATKGVYIAYLLAKDGKTLYLTLTQGCNDIRSTHTKAETVKLLRQKAESIAYRVDARGFATDGKIKLGIALPEYCELYEKGTVFYKAYQRGRVPSQEVLLADLKNMMDIYREYADLTTQAQWWPSQAEYPLSLTTADWKKFLTEVEFPNYTGPLKMLKGMMELGGEASCKQLSQVYGGHPSVYVGCAMNLGRRAKNFFALPPCMDGDQERYFPYPFVGKLLGSGGDTYVYKIRPELLAALKEFDMTQISPNYVPAQQEAEETLTTKEKLTAVKAYIAAKGFHYAGDLIENFYLCLKSKPFVILAGTSGTGKTRLVKLFAEAIGAKMQLVPVRPDWSDSSDLFGHNDLSGNFRPGAIIDFVKQAEQDKETPHFLCLDEMNLARVEYYLSDFLSIIETRDRRENGSIETDTLVDATYFHAPEAREKYGRVYIPENLYIIGTVNMDETTFPFSKKVLDRANTIEFSFVDLTARSDGFVPSAPQKLDNRFLKTEYLYLSDCADEALLDRVCFELEALNHILVKANLHVGYRVRDEIAFYMANNKSAGLLPFDTAFDYQIMQKLLPRIQGSSSGIKAVLSELFMQCAADYTGFSGMSTYEQMESCLAGKSCKYPNSAKKLAFMMRRYEEDGFTSYWL